MTRANSKTSNVYTRVDPETKAQAEMILTQLGIPMSNAIGMFLKQVVLHRGIPFNMTLPDTKPIAAGALTKEQSHDHQLCWWFAQIPPGFISPIA